MPEITVVRGKRCRRSNLIIINPFDLIHDCRVDNRAVRHWLLGEEANDGVGRDAEPVSGPGLAARP